MNVRNKHIISLLAAFSVFLTGCSSFDDTYNSFSDSGDAYDEEFDQELADIISGEGGHHIQSEQDKTEYTDEEKELFSKKVTIAETSDFTAAVCEIIEYPPLSVVPIAEGLERWYDLPEVDHTPEYGHTDTLPLDPDELYERVSRNTDEWIRTGKAFGESKLNEDDMKFCCEMICQTMNREIPELEYDDQLDDIDYMLHNLTMFENVSGLSNAAIYDDGSLHYSRVMSENMSIVTDYENVAGQIVTHETEHIMQKMAIDDMKEMGLERGYGFMVDWADMEYDPMFFNWYVEASAERLASDFHGIDPITYESKVGYLDSFSVIAVLYGNEHDSLPRLTQQQSLDRFFEMFHCSTEEEKLELLTAFYALEIIQEEPEAYMDYCAEQLGRDITDDDLVDIKLEIKSSLLSTMNKYFYRSLADFVSTNDVTFEELCFIIGGWEMDVHSHFTFTESYVPAGYIEPFVDYSSSLQLAFFDSLAGSMGVPADKLMETYQAYYTKIPSSYYNSIFSDQNTWKYVDIGCLDECCSKLFNTLFEKQSEHKTISLYDYAN